MRNSKTHSKTLKRRLSKCQTAFYACNTCLNGRKLKFRRESTKTTENGYTISTKYYSNDKYGRCPHRDKCHKSKVGYRTVKVNQVILEHRPKTLESLMSEEGTLLRMNRSIQVEGVICSL